MSAVYIHKLSGVDFHSDSVSCPCCSWAGQAGELIPPGAEQLGERVVYTCPRCNETVAEHCGLNDTEVQQELTKIRSELKQEFHDMAVDDKSHASDVTYRKVRERIRQLA